MELMGVRDKHLHDTMFTQHTHYIPRREERIKRKGRRESRGGKIRKSTARKSQKAGSKVDDAGKTENPNKRGPEG